MRRSVCTYSIKMRYTDVCCTEPARTTQNNKKVVIYLSKITDLIILFSMPLSDVFPCLWANYTNIVQRDGIFHTRVDYTDLGRPSSLYYHVLHQTITLQCNGHLMWNKFLNNPHFIVSSLGKLWQFQPLVYIHQI